MMGDDDDGDDGDDNDDIYSGNLARWSSCKSKVKSNIGTTTKKQRGSPPLFPTRTPKQGDEGKSVTSIYTAPATSPSSNSYCSSPSPSVSIDSDSVHSVDTLKASNMPMAMIVDSRCWEDDDFIETLKD